MKFKNKNNYLAWSINPTDFPKNKGTGDQIKFLLNFGLLAPSGHNSQPWMFNLKSNFLEIVINPARFLNQNDVQGRQSFISFGCLIENLMIAADFFGFNCNIKYFPNSELVATMEFNKNGGIKDQPDHLLYSIPQRWSNRGKYKHR